MDTNKDLYGEKRKDTEEVNINSVDSSINTSDAEGKEGTGESLTFNEDYHTDPNEVADKPSFSDNDRRHESNDGRFDGTVGI